MSLSLNKQVVIGGSVIFVWVVYTFAAFVYFTNQKLVSFDPSNSLMGASGAQIATDLYQLADFNSTAFDRTKPSIIHFIDNDCKCQNTSLAHIKEIDLLAQQHNYNVTTVNVSDYVSLLPLVTSVPSIAILGNNGEFVYFGPYGEGLACSETAGFAQAMLNNYLKGYNAELIASEAKGCYCNI